MIRFRNLSIRKKLTLLLMGTSAVAVLLASLGFYLVVLQQYRGSYSRDLEAQAKVIGYNAEAALMFEVPEDAEKILATLRTRSSVVTAGIYDAGGTLLASYSNSDIFSEKFPCPRNLADWAPPPNMLLVRYPVEKEGGRLGTVCLLDNMQPLKQFTSVAGRTLALIIVAVLGVTFLLAARFQKTISEPITELAALSTKVWEDQDYSLRGRKRTSDEVGELVDAFNTMLSQIAERNTALQQSENRFRSLVDQAGDPLFVHDLEGMIVDVNRRTSEVLGYSREELLAMSVADVDVMANNVHYRDLFWKKLEPGFPITIEGRHKRKDGTTFPVEVRVGPLVLGGERLVIAMARDITERLEAEAEKLRLKSQLQQSQKMESIGTLAGGVAHDLNNILCPIFGYIEMAMEKTTRDNPVRPCLEEMFKAAERAKDLVEQILTFSRQGTDQRSPVDIKIIVKEAIRLLRASIPSSIEIKHRIDTQCGNVLANPTQIHQILMNLCTNAAHAMREKGGVLEVSLQRNEFTTDDLAKNIELTPGPYLTLAVSDTGHGMDPKVRERIFEPYFTTKGPGEGTGMGLSVVHGIVKNHGGSITVYSEPGKGSTFRVYLPELTKTASDLERVVPSAPAPRGTESILLVDDEDAIVRMGKSALEGLGYKVTGFLDPEEALIAFLQDPRMFDVVITDMTMPKMKGDELAERITAVRADIPILLCSGFTQVINEEEAKKLGVRDIVLKPILYKELSKKIRALFDTPVA